MQIDIVSVFPEYFDVLNLSLFGKAQSKGLVSVHAHNLRDWTHDVHHSVDDTPVGGGAGMVMKPEVWAECLDDLLGLEPQDMSANDDADSTAAPAETDGAAQETAASDALQDAQSGNDLRTPIHTPDTVLIFPNPSHPCLSSVTRPSSATPNGWCSAVGAMRAMTRVFRHTIGHKAWTCANIRSAIMCSTAAKSQYR